MATVTSLQPFGEATVISTLPTLTPVSAAACQLHNNFPCLALTGPPGMRGFAYGIAFRDKIRSNINRSLEREDIPTWETCEKLIQGYKEELAKEWPTGYEEMKGIAMGADVSIDRIVFLNAREDIAALSPLLVDDAKVGSRNWDTRPRRGADQTITSWFTAKGTASGEAIVAWACNSTKQVLDENLFVSLEFHHSAEENVPTVFLLTEAGMISGVGMNSARVAATGNYLFTTADHLPEDGETYFPLSCLNRYLLQCTSIREARGMLYGLVRNTSRHVFLGDEVGACSVEITPVRIIDHNRKTDATTQVHTNHLVSLEAFQRRHEMQDRFLDASSKFRLYRLEDLIAVRGSEPWRLQDIVDLFSDHNGEPDMICRHPKAAEESGSAEQPDDEEKMMVAFVMFNPQHKLASVCKGPACQGRMIHVTLAKLATRESAQDEDEDSDED